MFINSVPVALLGLIWIASTAWAGVTLQGIVTDPAGQPVKRAEIRVQPRNGGKLLAAAQTDANGSYAISNLPTGTYRVTLLVNSAVRAAINNTHIRPSRATELNFHLQKRGSERSGKHMVWIPASTDSRMGGRWVEIDKAGALAAPTNVRKVTGTDMQRQNPSSDFGIPERGSWARQWIHSNY